MATFGDMVSDHSKYWFVFGPVFRPGELSKMYLYSQKTLNTNYSGN